MITVAALSMRSVEAANEDKTVMIFSSRSVLGLGDTKTHCGALQRAQSPRNWGAGGNGAAARFNLILLPREIGTTKHSKIGNS